MTMTAKTKLEEKLEERQQARTVLLDLRRQCLEQQSLIKTASARVHELRLMLDSKRKSLVDLTNEVTQLLHADVAGITGERDSDAPPVSLSSPPGVEVVRLA